MVPVTAGYAGLLTVLYLVLSWRVISYRRSAGLSLSDGGDKVMRRRIRAHGNAAEYMPLGILLLGLTELQGAPALALHGLGLMLLIGRSLHAAALSRSRPWILGRVGGMMLTLGMLSLTALGLIAHSLG